MDIKMRSYIAHVLEKNGVFEMSNWKAEVADGLVRVTQYTGNRKNKTVTEMTWDSFTHLFLLNK